jgi:hypothetical protein
VRRPKYGRIFGTFLTFISGRQLFERNKIVEDENMVEEGTVSVDFSQYERTNEEDEHQEVLAFSDSD